MAAETKNYIISFQAMLKGDKIVLTGLRQMEGQAKKFTKTVQVTGKDTKKLTNNLMRLGQRALLTIPIWLVLRSAFMGLLRTFGDMVRASIELEEGMARIKTVVSASSDSIDTDMITIKRQILDTATSTRVSIKELAEMFYFLRTANLDTREAMAAFIPTVNAMVGTMGNAKSTARAVALIYNTMGKFIGENISVSEKFKRITDVLTFTYATQDVQMDELIQGYTKLAPFISGLSDSFVDLVTMIGVFNTRGLRAGRTGRLMGRTILQLTKNAKQLAATFSVTFKPDEPINLLNVLKQISAQISQTGRVTAQQGEALRRVFATRGAVVPRLIITDINEMVEAVERANTSFEGFAERMAQIRMETISAQMQRMKNILAVLNNDFISGVFAVGEFAQALDLMNDSMVGWRQTIGDVGIGIGWLVNEWAKLELRLEAWSEAHQDEFFGFINPGAWARRFRRAQDMIKAGKLEPQTLTQFMIEQDKLLVAGNKKREERLGLLTKERKAEEALKKLNLIAGKEEKESVRHQVTLLKMMGASQLDIARFKLETLRNSTLEKEESQKGLELMRAENEVLEAQQKRRREITTVLQRAELDMLRVMGATELQILEVKERQLKADRESMLQSKFLQEMGNLRIQQAIALQKQQQKELDTVRSLVIQYAKADKFQRGRIRRAMELRLLDPTDIAQRFRTDAFDQAIILDFWNIFGQRAQEEIGKVAQALFRLPEGVPKGKTPKLTESILPIDEIRDYWTTWTEQGIKAGKTVNASFRAGMPTLGMGAIAPGVTPPITPVGITPTIPKTKGFFEVAGRKGTLEDLRARNAWELRIGDKIIKGGRAALEITIGQLQEAVREQTEQIREEGEKNRAKLDAIKETGMATNDQLRLTF